MWSEFRYLLRVLANVLAVLLLLLSFVSAALWARSHWVTDCVRYYGSHTDGHSTTAWRYALDVSRAGIDFRSDRSAYTSVAPVRPQAYSVSSSPVQWVRMGPSQLSSGGGLPPGVWRAAGFTFYYSGNRGGPSATFTSSYLGHWYVQCPHSGLFAIASLVPFLKGWRWCLRGRRGLGVCPACGYDLRASPDRCPECGRLRTPEELARQKTQGPPRDGPRVQGITT